MNKKVRQYAILFLSAAVIIALDQWTKILVRQNLALNEIYFPFGWDWLYPNFYFIHWFNNGAAFGIFQNGGAVFAALAIIVSGVIIYYFPRIPDEDWTLRMALGLQLGGALGNLIDRLTVGHVTDFIAVGTFPIFNIADMAISIGVAVLILGLWLKEADHDMASLKEMDETANPENQNTDDKRLDDTSV